VEINSEHLKFFRFRSPAYVKGEVDGAGWIFNSIEWLDYDTEMFLNESYVIMQITNGGYSYTELREMDFNDYEMIIKITKPIADKMNDSIGG
jgi:hypothetical protein